MSNPANPYSPPQSSASDGSAHESGGPLYVFDKGLFVVDAEKKIPGVCLKCSDSHGVERREETLAVGTAGASVGALGGIVGAAVANALRHAGEAIVPVLAAAVVIIIVIGLVVHFRTERVRLQLPLCKACNDRWTQGVRYRTGFLMGLGVLGVGVALGFLLDDTTLLVMVGGGFVLLLIVAAGAKLPGRFLTARRKVGSRVHLFGVDARVPSAIEQRRAAKAAKRAASQAADASA